MCVFFKFSAHTGFAAVRRLMISKVLGGKKSKIPPSDVALNSLRITKRFKTLTKGRQVSLPAPTTIIFVGVVSLSCPNNKNYPVFSVVRKLRFKSVRLASVRVGQAESLRALIKPRTALIYSNRNKRNSTYASDNRAVKTCNCTLMGSVCWVAS